jgi:hypothetical protein
MLEWLWQLWRYLTHVFLTREDLDHEREEDAFETAFQIGCLIVVIAVGMLVLFAWLSRV